MSKRLRDEEAQSLRNKLFPSKNQQQANKKVGTIGNYAEVERIPDYTKDNVRKITQFLIDELEGRSTFSESKISELSWKSFAKLCEAAGCDQIKAKTLWSQTDKDNSGTLDREEFFQFCARRDIYPTVAKMAVVCKERMIALKKRKMAADELFDFLDKNNDNMLSWEEFKVLCKGAGCSPQQAISGWSVADEDDSGSLDRDEFRKFATSNTCWPVMAKLHSQVQHMKLVNVKPMSNTIFEELQKQYPDMESLDELTFDQFAALCKVAGATSTVKANELFKSSDEDQSGTISRKEFAYFCARRDVYPVIKKIHAHIKAKKKKSEEEEKAGE